MQLNKVPFTVHHCQKLESILLLIIQVHFTVLNILKSTWETQKIKQTWL